MDSSLWGECIHMVLGEISVSGVYRALCVLVGFGVNVHIWSLVCLVRQVYIGLFACT